MERKEFLSKLGKGALFALSVSCVGACTKSEQEEAQDNNDSSQIDDIDQNTQDHNSDANIDNQSNDTNNEDSSNVVTQEESYDTDFTINLEDDDYSSLQQVSAYVVKDGIVIAKDLEGNYVAATQTCSHQDNDAIVFTNKDQWQCEIHGARFDLQGNGLNSLASNGLKVYSTELSGTVLRVYG